MNEEKHTYISYMNIGNNKVKKNNDDDGDEIEIGEQLENALKYISFLENDIKKLCRLIAKSFCYNKSLDERDIEILDEPVINNIKKEYEDLINEEEI